MKTETVHYQADVALTGTVFVPQGEGPRGAAVLFPDIFGFGEHVLDRAEAVARLGYVTLAADLHGDGLSMAVEPAMAELDRFYREPDAVIGRAEAALRVLMDRPDVDGDRVAGIGFCFGGRLALELARRGAPLAAVIGFHSSLVSSTPDREPQIRGSILACIGSEDPGVPVAEREAFEAEMRAADVEWQLLLLGGVYHTFTNPRCDDWGSPDFARYDARADRRSWGAMEGLLAETIGDR